MAPNFCNDLFSETIYNATQKFVTSDSVRNWGNFIPRNGHTKDIAYLFSVDNERQYDYIKGLPILPYFILVFYIMWCISLLTFKFMDARQVGFLAGRNIVGSDILNKFSKQMRNVRIGFLISAGLLMASTVVFFIEAQDSLDETITQYQKGSGGLGSITNETVLALDNLNEIGEESAPLRDELLVILNSQLCVNFTAADYFKAGNQVVNSLAKLDDFGYEATQEYVDIMKTWINQKETFDDYVNDLNEYTNYLKFCSFPIIILGLSMSIATILVWKGSSLGWYKSIQSWFVLPIFITVILVSVILLVGAALISTVNADFCTGGAFKNPAGTIWDIMKEQRLDIGAKKYQAVLNYSHVRTTDLFCIRFRISPSHFSLILSRYFFRGVH